MDAKENAIKAISAKIEQLYNVSTIDQYNIWRKATASTIANIYPKGSGVVSTFDSIRAYDGYVEDVPKAK
ncbi:MAG: hypothetical protein IT221_13535, partial [Fluviicola sp.]|nr:hypothetical protein [Fluviicola sp.]